MIKTPYAILILSLCLLLNNKIQAQFKNDFHASLYNVGFGGVIGGIGAVINKKPNDKLGKVFLKGFGQGALGGLMLFESKHLLGKFSKTGNYAYVWPSKIVNAAGISIIENASANRQFWEQWHINFGFNRFEFYTQDKFRTTYRVMPFALVNTIYDFTQGKLNLSESIKIGSFVFTSNRIIINRIEAKGFTLANSIVITTEKRTFSKQEILAHELIHVYQYESFSGLNPYLNKSLSRLNDNKKWARAYHKIFYSDFNHLTFQGLYSLYKNYYYNFYENEAYYYSRQY